MSHGFELATVEVLCERTGASPAAAAVVLQALPQALNYAVAGAPDEALVTLNQPLINFTPVSDLLVWFSPPVVNKALGPLAAGDRVPMQVCLDAMGLLATTGDAWDRMQAALAEDPW